MAETDYPLLVFPEPALAERAKRSGFGGEIKKPDASRQARRLVPQFQRLQEAMDNRRLALQDHPLGVQPELVLVLETIGPIEDFIRAVNRVRGLEWLGEGEFDDMPPEFGFEDPENGDKLLKGQLFLVMTDQRALNQMRSLFEVWERDPDAPFPYGLARLKRAFEHLRTIRHWGVEDRIRETGVLEDWAARLEQDQAYVPFEAELWFRKTALRREQAESHLREVIDSVEGQVVGQCLIPEIGYHALLGRLPRVSVQAIIADAEAFRDIQLLQCEDLMHARPVGQCTFPISRTEETEPLAVHELGQLEHQGESPNGDPVIALFDGMPLTGHVLLDKRLEVDDPEEYEAAYQAHERVHGTGMASLICHGDLNHPGTPADRPVYVRPILQPRRGFNGEFVEEIPDSVLPVDLIHRAVRRLFDGDENQPAAAPEVQVISLSVGNLARPFLREMSAWARLLDWLSWKHQVLFVVSAGNHIHEVELRVPRPELQGLSAEIRERNVVEALAADTRNRRLLSPAETLNGLTIGAAHDDDGPRPGSGHLGIDPFVGRGLPSVASAHGPGYGRAVKPDVFFPGGRQLLLEKMGTGHSRATLRLHSGSSPPGQRVASPGGPGQVDRTHYTRGTSNAAALASHGAGAVLGLLEELRGQPGPSLPREYDVVLAKALMAHGASWDGALDRLESHLKNHENSRNFKEYVGRFIGYGLVDLARVMTCTEERVTVLGFGKLDDGEGAEFAFPLPPSLSEGQHRRRLTVTLAWLSPVNVTRLKYRVAHLWFGAKNTVATKRLFADFRAVQRGTLQHEVFEGDRATVFQDGDSVTVKVNCRADAGDVPEPIRYGLAVTLEIAASVPARLVQIPIYQEVRDRLAVRVPIRDQEQ